MSSDYLWVHVQRYGRTWVLAIDGDLDGFTVGQLAEDVARAMDKVPGQVVVELSGLQFIDCSGARALAAVIGTIPAWQLTEVQGCTPLVRRVLELLGLDLMRSSAVDGKRPEPSGRPGWRPGPLASGSPVRELMEHAEAVNAAIRETLLQTSAVTARLAATYDEIAASRKRQANPGNADLLLDLGTTARDLSRRCRLAAHAGREA